MTFTCIICKRNQPLELGRTLSSGSWVCKDTDDCISHLPDMDAADCSPRPRRTSREMMRRD